MDGWNTEYDCFLLGRGMAYFQVRNVSFKEGIIVGLMILIETAHLATMNATIAVMGPWSEKWIPRDTKTGWRRH